MKLLLLTAITVFFSTSFADGTKCSHQISSTLNASTNPPVKAFAKVKTAEAASASTAGVR